MRVLHVIAGAKRGGAESFMADAVTALAQAGVAQHVVTRAQNADQLAQFAQAGVPVSIATSAGSGPALPVGQLRVRSRPSSRT